MVLVSLRGGSSEETMTSVRWLDALLSVQGGVRCCVASEIGAAHWHIVNATACLRASSSDHGVASGTGRDSRTATRLVKVGVHDHTNLIWAACCSFLTLRRPWVKPKTFPWHETHGCKREVEWRNPTNSAVFMKTVVV